MRSTTLREDVAVGNSREERGSGVAHVQFLHCSFARFALATLNRRNYIFGRAIAHANYETTALALKKLVEQV